jgi:hypothetical protein
MDPAEARPLGAWRKEEALNYTQEEDLHWKGDKEQYEEEPR